MIVTETRLSNTAQLPSGQDMPNDGLPVVAGYIRVSSKEQAVEGYSLETQAEHIRNECKRRFSGGCHLIFIADDGVSGALPIRKPGMKKKEFRPGLTLLAEMVGKGLVDAVGVYRCNRLTRKLRTWAEFSDYYLKPTKTLFFSCADGLDNSGDGGQLPLQALMSSTEYEYEQIVSACNDGKRQRHSEGYYLGEPPYGWRWQDKRLLGHGKRVNIEPVSYQAQVIRKIVQLYLSGKSPYEIARELTRLRIPPPRGGDIWYKRVIKFILSNPTNAGLLRDGAGGVVQGFHYSERIIEVKEFERVQEEMRRRREQNADMNRPTGLIFDKLLQCGLCGRHLELWSPTNRAPYYICPGRTPAKKHPQCQISTNLLEKRLERLMLTVAGDATLQDLARKKLVMEQKLQTRELGQHVSSLKTKMNRIEQDSRSWGDRFGSDAYPEHEVISRLQELTAKKRKVQSDIDRANGEIRKLERQESRLQAMSKLVQQVHELWRSMTVGEKRELASLLIETAILESKPGHVALHVKLTTGTDQVLGFYVRGRSANDHKDEYTLGPATLTTAYYLNQGLDDRTVADKCDICLGTLWTRKSMLKKITGAQTIEEALKKLTPVIDERQDELLLNPQSIDKHTEHYAHAKARKCTRKNSNPPAN